MPLQLITPLVDGKFGSLNERFDWLAAVEYHPRPGHGKTGRQQQQQLQQ
jgi:hypothetical protein